MLVSDSDSRNLLFYSNEFHPSVKKNIEPREELFMDYGDEYFTGDKDSTPRASGKR